MKKLLNRLNCLPARFVAKKTSRQELERVNITKDYTEATDGYIAIRVTRPSEFEAKDFPKGADTELLDEEEYQVDGKSLKDLEKEIPKKSSDPILCNAVEVGAKEGVAAMQFVNPEHTEVIGNKFMKKYQEHYPNLNPLLEAGREAEGIEVKVNPAFLETIVKAMKDFQKGESAPYMTIKVSAKDKAVYFVSKRKDGQEAEALAMPIRD